MRIVSVGVVVSVWVWSLAAMQMGVNGWFLEDWVPTLASKNLVKESRAFHLLKTGDNRDYPHGPGDPNYDPATKTYKVPSDENGYPLELPYGGYSAVAKLFMTDYSPASARPTGTYTLLVEGKGELAVRFGQGGADAVITANGGETKYEFKVTNPNFQYLNIRITRSEKNDHVRAMRLIIPDSNGGTSYVSDYQQDPWNPVMLEDLRPFSTFRFMDWNKTNNNLEVNWNERVLPGSESGLSYEDMISLCNRKNMHMWVCVPYQANSDYHLQLAQLVKAKLKPSLKVYVEYANETWNTIFQATAYTRAEGIKLGFDSTPWKAGAKYHAYMAANIIKAFRSVFDADSGRVVGVIGGVSAASTVNAEIVNALNDTKINPWRIKADALAIAPYFGHKAGSLDALRGDIANAKNQVEANYSVAQASGLSLLAYEAGQHMEMNVTVNYDPSMYETYNQYLAAVSPRMQLMVHYAFIGRCSDKNCWGIKKYTGMPSAESPKYRALWDFVENNGGVQPVPPLDQSVVTTNARYAAHRIVKTTSKEAGAAFFDLHGRKTGNSISGIRILVSQGNTRGVIKGIPGL